MNKDVLVTVGGVLALSSVLFGAGLFIAGTALESSSTAQAAVVEKKPETDPHAAEAKGEDGHGDAHGAKKEDAHGAKPEDAHGAKTDDAHGGGHGDGHGKKKEEEKPAEPEDNSEYLGVLEKKFNDLFARGLYEDARGIALKGSTLDNTSAAWQRHLADSTFMSEELAGQQRYQRAYEIYSKMIVDDPAPRESEWPRYRAVLCLKNLHRWEEATQAADTYIKSYKSSSRSHEVALIQAQCQYALGERDESRKTIEKLLALEVPSDVRAAAMLELAHIERATPPSDAANTENKAEVIPIVDTKKKAPVLDDKEANAPKKLELSSLVPAAQWESIRNASKIGNFQEAQRLIGPWLDANNPLSSEQRARIALDYAALLKELSHAGH